MEICGWICFAKKNVSRRKEIFITFVFVSIEGRNKRNEYIIFQFLLNKTE
jgi:hypothetical protein